MGKDLDIGRMFIEWNNNLIISCGYTRVKMVVVWCYSRVCVLLSCFVKFTIFVIFSDIIIIVIVLTTTIIFF